MQIPMTITHAGVTSRVVAFPPDLSAYEKHFGESITKFGAGLQSGDVELSRIFWLAWQVSRRTRKTGLDFDSWLEDLEDCTTADDEPAPGPLELTPSPG